MAAHLDAGVQQALAAPAGTRGAKEPTMDTEDVIALLAAAPATAYREYLYRPHGQFARWIGDRFEVVAKPGQRIGRAPQAGDVLLQVRLGHIHLGRCIVLGDRDHQLATAPPRLAPGQLLLRPRSRAQLSEPLPVEPAAEIPYFALSPAAEPWAAGSADDPTEAITPVTTLTSPRFAGDSDLGAVAKGTLRLAAPGTPPYPAPVLSQGPAIAKIQQALIDLSYPLPQHGADGRFGAETGTAVTKYKTARSITPNDPVIGRLTIASLDTDIIAHDQPAPPPPTPREERLVPGGWFLTGSVIEQYRTPAYTTRNTMYLEREGDQYFSDLSDECAPSRFSAGTTVLVVGWRFSAEQRLRPRTSSQTIIDALLDVKKFGGTVRALVYGALFATSPVRIAVPGLPSKDNFDFAAKLRSNGIDAILDTRLARLGSQHQKVVVVGRPDPAASAAYVGGIDICVDRYDTINHDFRPERQIEPPVLIPIPRTPFTTEWKTSQDGWHDVQAALHGPAVSQVWQALVERWNDPAPLPGGGVTPIPPGEAPATGPTPATLAVQVLRTVPCNGIFQSFPNGEQTIRAAYEKAIRQAQHYIYIEDQYFWPSPVMDALQDAVRRGVHVIAMVARDYDIPGLGTVHKNMRSRTARYIAQPHPDHFRIFHKERLRTSEAVYVHSKLMIIDDLYMAVGTANVNWRSHTNDTELHLGCFDEELVDGYMGGIATQVGREIRRFRQDLWAEHLNMSQDALLDPIDAIQHWPSRSGRKVGQAVWHDLAPAPSDASEALLTWLLILLQAGQGPWTIAAEALASAGIVLKDLPNWGHLNFDPRTILARIPDPAKFIEDVVLNPRLICGGNQ